MSKLRFHWWLPVALVVLGRASAWAQGCAMCASSLTPNDPVTKALNASILFLLLTPYALLGGVGAWLYVMYRRRGSQPRATVHPMPWPRPGASPGAGFEEE